MFKTNFSQKLVQYQYSLRNNIVKENKYELNFKQINKKSVIFNVLKQQTFYQSKT